MLAKLTDALAMFWSSLDARERHMLLYGVAFVAVQVVMASAKHDQDRREQQLLARVEEMVQRGR